MKDLKISLIQTDLNWEDTASNIEMFDEKIDSISEETDLIVLPEMFTTGFTMNVSDFAQDEDGSSIKWLKKKSETTKVDIVGSIVFKEDNKFFNRLIWVNPAGEHFTYDKKHLFRMSGEEKVYSPGKEKITIDLNGWKIRPFICYDLRFPLWTRNFENAYDVAIFVANWPEKRSAHWKVLLQARAIENQSFVIGVNRVGSDGKGFTYSGDSSVIDPRGNIVFQKSHTACTFTANLSYTLLEEYRKKFPAWMDADRDLVLVKG